MMLNEITEKFINSQGMAFNLVKCSFCDGFHHPEDMLVDATYPQEIFCSDKCLANWDDMSVAMNRDDEFDWDNELKRQQGL